MYVHHTIGGMHTMDRGQRPDNNRIPLASVIECPSARPPDVVPPFCVVSFSLAPFPSLCERAGWLCPRRVEAVARCLCTWAPPCGTLSLFFLFLSFLSSFLFCSFTAFSSLFLSLLVSHSPCCTASSLHPHLVAYLPGLDKAPSRSSSFFFNESKRKKQQ